MTKAKTTAASKSTKKTATRAPARRKAAAPKKGRVADSWAEGYRPFVEAAREHFGFLVRDHGFAEPEVTIAPPSALLQFRRGSDFVQIGSEYVCEPFVAVHAGVGAPIGLAALIAELEPEAAANKPTPAGSVLEPDEMRAVLAYQGAFLARHPEALRGDPALVARLEARQAALRSPSS